MQNSDAVRIIVEKEDGSQVEIEKGMGCKFTGDTMNMYLVDCSRFDVVRIAYGIMAVVDQMGLKKALMVYANGGLLPDEENESE